MAINRFIIALACLFYCHASQAAPAIDGSNVQTSVGAASITFTLTTANANDVIIVFLKNNGATSCPAITSISDTAGLFWTRRASVAYAPGASCDDEWYAVSGAALSGDTITVNTPMGGLRGIVFGISGANAASPFDENVSIPGTGVNASGSPSMVISTNNANDMLIGTGICTTVTGSITVPAGWSLVAASGNASSVFGFANVTALQSNVTETFTTSGTVNMCGAIVDAVMQASAGGSSSGLLINN